MNASSCNKNCSKCRCTLSQDCEGHLLCFQIGLVKILEFVSDLFQRDDISFWIMGGTLLGAVRNHQMIPWDFDIDIGVWENDVSKILALRSQIQEAGFFLDSDAYETGTKNSQRISISLSSDCSRHLDLFPWTIQKDVAYSKFNPRYSCSPSDLQDLVEVEFENKKYSCPDHYERMLEKFYGETWRIPTFAEEWRIHFKPEQKILENKYDAAIRNISKRKTVYTSGAWDLFHVGHLNMIKRAWTYGDVLIIGVSTDELVESYKGKRPFNTYEERFSIIQALKYSDLVVEQTGRFDVAQMKELHVDTRVVGDDWANIEHDGLNWMKQNREVVFLPRTEGVSTSIIKHKLKGNE